MAPAHGCCFKDPQVDSLFDGAESIAADRIGVGEVKPQSVGLDLAPGLLCVLSQDAAKGMMQEMRRGVGTTDRVTAADINLSANRRVDGQFAFGDMADVQDEVIFFLGVVNPEQESVAADDSDITYLPAGLAVKRGPIEDNDQRRSAIGLGPFGETVLFEDADDSRLLVGRRVADELAAVVIFSFERIEWAGGKDVRGLGCAARDDRMPAALGLKGCFVDAQVVVGRQALDDFDGNAVSRMQGKGVLAGNDVCSPPTSFSGRCRSRDRGHSPDS